MSTVLVIGSLPDQTQRDLFEKLAFRIGKEVVKRRHELLTGGGGDTDPLVVDKFSAMGAKSICEERNYHVKEWIRSVVREGVDPHNIGLFYRSTGDVEPEQLISLTRRASAIIVCGGGVGTKQYLVVAEATATPIIPVPVFGGVAEEYWNRYVRSLPNHFPEFVKPEDFEDLNQVPNTGVSLDSIAEAAVLLAKKSLSDSNYVFVATPFTETFDNTFRAIEQAINNINEEMTEIQFQPDRIDKADDVVSIDKEIEERIRRAKIVIADVTEQSANVYYEFGFARGHNVTVLPIASEGTELPFNVRQFRTELYDLSVTDIEAMEKKIERFAGVLEKRIRALFRTEVH